MRKKIVRLVLTVFIVLMGFSSFAQEVQLPENFQEQMLQEYNALPEPRDLSFPEFYNVRADDYIRVATLELHPDQVYGNPFVVVPSPCDNGDFEAGLLTSAWQGGYGSVNSAGVIQYGTFTAGILGGPINNTNSHQTLVSAGIDPNVPISMVAPGGSTKAVRIGNSINGNGAELLSKTFTVTAANSVIGFWYAVVLEDPSHNPNEQPAFRVRILNSSGTDITTSSMVNLGNGSNVAVSDHNNPFFKSVNNGTLVYRDWTCAQLNLSSLVGQQITVQFVTNDCSLGGHYGYAYLDNFCGTCGTNNYHFSVNQAQSTKCGNGSIAYNYQLPTQGSTTGTIQITLHFLQNGVQFYSVTSPVLNTGTGYAFSVNPTSLPGINLTLGAFDYYATASFMIGTTSLGTLIDGNPIDGMITAQNNDYKIYCGNNTDCSDTCYWKVTGNNIIGTNNLFGTLTNHDVRILTNSIIRGVIKNTGQFGMGTSIPYTTLQVHSLKADLHISASGNAPSLRLQSPETALPGAPSSFGIPYAKIGLATGANNFTAGSTPGDLILQTIDNSKSIIFSNNFVSGNGVEQMRLNAAGSLGIGTNNPQTRLHVAGGDITIDNNRRVILGSALSGGGNGEWIQNSRPLTGANYGIAFFANSVEKMRINNNGNVGIGSIAPGNRLEITHGVANNSGLRFTNLTSASPAGAGIGKVLTVNASGDVVLVQDASGGGLYSANQGVTLSGSVFQLGDDCGRGGGGFFSNREINMRDNYLYFNSGNKGKLYMGAKVCPDLTTRLEISSSGLQTVNGYSPLPSPSGLRFTDLTAYTPPVRNQYKGVLSLDTDGDVIWVEDQTGGGGNISADNGLSMNGSVAQLGRVCEDDANTSADLQDNRAVPLNNHNLLFKDGLQNVSNQFNRVGIGEFYGKCDLDAKLHVEKQPVQVDDFFSIGILSHNADMTKANEGTAIAVKGITDAQKNNLNIGVQGIGISDGFGFAQGGNFSACNGKINIGVYAEACESNNNGNGPSYAGYFNGDVFSTGLYVGSDQRIKKDVQPISNALDILSKIEPKKYEFDQAKYPALHMPSGENYGVIAQQLEKVLPSLVKDVAVPSGKGAGALSNETIKSVNYTELVPILIQAVNDQQAQIKAQQAQIDELMAVIKGGNGMSSAQQEAITKINVELSDKNLVVLGQNVPNPFSSYTSIGFNIPKEIKRATVNFTSADGKALRSVEISNRGKGVLNVYANELNAGIYMYTLIVDGKVAETKKMEIVK